MPNQVAAGLLDTSVVIDLGRVDPAKLPLTMGISVITLAELTAGPPATTDVMERARRQDRLARVEATFDPFPFGLQAARAYGQVYAAVVAAEREPRRRLTDLLIAATAVAEEVPLYTRNAGDFAGLEELVDVIAI